MGENWELAKPIVLTLAAFVSLVAAVWWATRERASLEWLRVPLYFFSATVALTLFFRAEVDLVSQNYALATAIAAAISGVIHLFVTLFFRAFISRQREIRFPPLLRNVTLTLSYVAILLLCIKTFNRDFSLTPFLVTSGVLSLIVGLALQDILGNFLAGLVLTVEQPFRIDDWIELGSTRGKVIAVTWRTTHLLTRDHDTLLIPNKKVVEAELVNVSSPSPLHQERMPIGLPYETLPSLAEQALLEAVGRVEGVLRTPAPRVYVAGFDDSAIEYELGIWTDDPDALFKVTSEVRREVFYALRRHGISIPFPIRDVRQRSVEAPEQNWKESYRHRLEVVAGPSSGLVFPLVGDSVIGRTSECAIELRDPAISKQHACLRASGDHFVVDDLGSAHGTRVNGQPPTGEPLRTGDEIAVGSSILRFEEIVST